MKTLAEWMAKTGLAWRAEAGTYVAGPLSLLEAWSVGEAARGEGLEVRTTQDAAGYHWLRVAHRPVPSLAPVLKALELVRGMEAQVARVEARHVHPSVKERARRHLRLLRERLALSVEEVAS